MASLARFRVSRLAVGSLALALAVSATAVIWRSNAVAGQQQRSVDSAEGHFLDIVADAERRADAVAANIDVTMRAVVASLGSQPTAVDFDEAMAHYGAERLPGFAGAAVVEPDALVGATGHVDDHVVEKWNPLSWQVGGNGFAVEPTMAMDGGDLAAVVLPLPEDPESRLLMVFSTVEFLLGEGHEGHHFTATLTPASSADHEADGHDHGDHLHDTEVVHDHSSGARFSASREVEALGRDWRLEVATTDGFIETPTSREVPVLAALGLLLSVGVFALVEQLARSRDVARRMSVAQAARFAVGFERSPIGVVEADERGAVTAANGAALALLGVEHRDLLGRPVVEMFEDSSRPAAGMLLDTVGADDGSDGAMTAEERFEGSEVELRRSDDGDPRWVQLTASAAVSSTGRPATLLQLLDVTEQRNANAELRRRALHDELTGLPNRALLVDRLEQALARGRRSGMLTAALFLDLDRFKQVNDALGHSYGDEVLRQVAPRLSGAARQHDTVARFGGDEFVVLSENLTSAADACAIADRLREALSAPLTLGDEVLVSTVSIGIAVAAPDDDAEAVLRDADLAMYEAKAAGRDRWVLFNTGMREALVARLDRENDLKDALVRDELRVHFQPLLDLASDTVVGFEALVRWEHPRDGLLAPVDFLELADRLGLIVGIDRFVLRQALETVASWTDPDGRAFGVAVNASGATITDTGYPGYVAECLREVGFAPEDLTIEVTEQEIIGLDTASEVVRELRRLGVQVAIDDFGTGHSSFAQVAALAFDVVKIDRSLINDIDTGRGGEIVRTVIEMARTMGVTTVAEGVEAESDIERLRDLGSDLVQGYFIGRPMPAETVAERLGLVRRG